jgi:hypothetical protein
MNKLYRLVEGDTIRKFTCRLYSTLIPVTSVLVITSPRNASFRMERSLTLVGSVWEYRWQDADFDEFETGDYIGQVQSVFADSGEGSYPTLTDIQIKVRKKL